jgi:hypothetical protein
MNILDILSPNDRSIELSPEFGQTEDNNVAQVSEAHEASFDVFL